LINCIFLEFFMIFGGPKDLYFEFELLKPFGKSLKIPKGAGHLLVAPLSPLAWPCCDW
jgi:hypothetical protein